MIIEKEKPLRAIIKYFFLILLAIICIIPFWQMFVNSSYTNSQLVKDVYLWFGKWSTVIDNYNVVAEKADMFRGLLNSFIIAGSFTLLSAYFGAMTAYGFSKFRFKGRKFFFFFIIAMMMIPIQLGLIGYYELVNSFGWIDTYWPLIIPGIANIGTVFFVKMYMDSSLPNELIEAAHIDGAGEFFIFQRIALPLAVPSLATMSIFNFIGVWNNFLGPLVLLNSPEKMPMPVVISYIPGLYQMNYGAIYLAVSISVIPVLLAFVFLSKYIVGGLTMGSVKG